MNKKLSPLARILILVAVILIILVFVLAFAAIFVDSSPAEGNLGGAAGLMAFAAFCVGAAAAFKAMNDLDW